MLFNTYICRNVQFTFCVLSSSFLSNKSKIIDKHAGTNCMEAKQLDKIQGFFSLCWGINRLPGAPSGRCAWWWRGLPQRPIPLPSHSSARRWCTPASAVCSVVQTHKDTHNSYKNIRIALTVCTIGIVSVLHTCNLRRLLSMGMTLRMGSSTARTLGLLLTRQPSSMSQSAPSRYRPDTKQPEESKHFLLIYHPS